VTRRFAHSERLELRKITNDLLKRGIIKPSVSLYCARMMSVRKKDGQLRLCVDLRPLNNRIVKQKYPFPIIEDCLARLSGKSVFTLLDLKDGFHQIKVSSIVRRVLTRELRGECGAGGVLRDEGHDVTREGGLRAWRYKGGGLRRHKASLLCD